jgi:hypothetical protein
MNKREKKRLIEDIHSQARMFLMLVLLLELVKFINKPPKKKRK